MTGTQVFLCGVAAAAAVTALLAGWRERARGRREDVDAIGWVDWPLVQMLAFFAMAAAGLLAWRG